MAQIIDTFTSRKGRPPIHPWSEWADGKARRLFKGEVGRERPDGKLGDFTAELNSMRTMIHRKARDLDMNATTKINEADASIKVHFHPRKT